MRNPFARFRGKIALQLWGAMMLLVLFGIAFLWTVQILLFEPNYVHATVSQFESNIRPYVQNFETMNVEHTLSYISRAVNGRVVLKGKDGDILYVYAMGMPAKLEEKDMLQRKYMERQYPTVAEGNIVRGVMHRSGPGMMLMAGIPVKYDGKPAALFFTTSLTEMRTVQELNRRQLVVLSVSLTIAASLIALAFTRYFTKPVLSIKSAVNRLAEGDYTARPDVRREGELGELSDSVVDLAHVMMRCDVLRKEIIANVSHELRAPLAVIIGYSEMIRDITWKDEKLRNENLNLIISAADRLSRMVDDILDCSQFQAGYIKLNRELCDLCEIVKAEAGFGMQAAERYNLRIEFTSFAEGVTVDVDPIKIVQVLRNLLNNAINHTADGGTIEVVCEETPDGVRVSVINPGEHIPEDAQEAIWERYQRVQHQGGRREGTGIGLSIVGSILCAHGFAYGVDSADGKNAFWFVIPESACERRV